MHLHSHGARTGSRHPSRPSCSVRWVVSFRSRASRSSAGASVRRSPDPRYPIFEQSPFRRDREQEEQRVSEVRMEEIWFLVCGTCRIFDCVTRGGGLPEFDLSHASDLVTLVTLGECFWLHCDYCVQAFSFKFKLFSTPVLSVKFESLWCPNRKQIRRVWTQKCQKSVKIEGKKSALKTVQKREETIYKRRRFPQIYANFRKWPQKYAETFIQCGKL